MERLIQTPESILAEKWWAWALRGLCALVFGILALAWPAITLEVLIILFGAFALVAGIFALVSAVSPMERGRRVLLVLQGVVGIVVGVIAFAWPGITAVVLLILIAAWALVTGIFEIVGGFGLPAGASGKGLLTLILIIGIYAIIAAITLFALAFSVRKRQKVA